MDGLSYWSDHFPLECVPWPQAQVQLLGRKLLGAGGVLGKLVKAPVPLGSASCVSHGHVVSSQLIRSLGDDQSHFIYLLFMRQSLTM